jgi:ubiquinone/menaquinone biosynthesis C-methylase UbiE
MQAARRCLLLWALACAAPLWAQPAYETVQRTPDGIGKRYMGREIAGVMGWQGAAWLERQGREREERADLLVRELRLSAGMNVADVGAGTGFYSRRLAPLVAPGGIVFAVDVQPQMLRLLQAQAQESGLRNIRPVLASVRATGLAAQSVDLALLVDVYHELEFPFEIMQDVVRSLRPGGRVVLVEYRAEDPAVPIKPLHKMSQAQVKTEMAPHALVHESTVDVLPWQHVLIFRKP